MGGALRMRGWYWFERQITLTPALSLRESEQ